MCCSTSDVPVRLLSLHLKSYVHANVIVPDDVKVYTVSEPTVVIDTVPVVEAADVVTGTLIMTIPD